MTLDRVADELSPDGGLNDDAGLEDAQAASAGRQAEFRRRLLDAACLALVVTPSKLPELPLAMVHEAVMAAGREINPAADWSVAFDPDALRARINEYIAANGGGKTRT